MDTLGVFQGVPGRLGVPEWGIGRHFWGAQEGSGLPGGLGGSRRGGRGGGPSPTALLEGLVGPVAAVAPLVTDALQGDALTRAALELVGVITGRHCWGGCVSAAGQTPPQPPQPPAPPQNPPALPLPSPPSTIMTPLLAAVGLPITLLHPQVRHCPPPGQTHPRVRSPQPPPVPL